MWRRQSIVITKRKNEDIGPWKMPETDYRKSRKDIWIHYEVCRRYREEYCEMLTLVAMTASQMRIAETIDAFYGDAGARDGVSRSYKQAVEDLDAETIKALDGPYRCVLSVDLHHHLLTRL